MIRTIEKTYKINRNEVFTLYRLRAILADVASLGGTASVTIDIRQTEETFLTLTITDRNTM